MIEHVCHVTLLLTRVAYEWFATVFAYREHIVECLIFQRAVDRSSDEYFVAIYIEMAGNDNFSYLSLDRAGGCPCIPVCIPP